MNHLQLAIASIVDANTGSGFVRGGGIDYREEELRAHAIRSKSVHELFGAIAGRVRDAVADFRERSRERKALDALSYLNDHYLDDIGLTRGDIAAVRLGQTSLASLGAERRARLAVAPLERVATDAVDVSARAARAANQADYVEARCA